MKTALLVMLLVGVGSTTASAIVSIGDPWSGNSWGQRFVHVTDLDFESMRIDWTFGSEFELPTVFESFDDDSWTAHLENPIFASARGGVLGDLEFDIIFDGDIGPTGFTIATYREGVAQEYYSARYQESLLPDLSWQFTVESIDGAPRWPSEVPEPTTFLLLGAGAVLFAGHRLRKRLC